jgi:bifunctional non-homologous end joining protein LigD
VAFDADGRTSFAALQQRLGLTDPAQVRQRAAAVPVVFLAFDLLRLDELDVVGLTYAQRRELLDAVDLDGDHWQNPPYFAGGGAAALRVSRERGLEGIVAKRIASRYQPGRRSPDWLKIKTVRTQEVVIGGWKPGAGRREGGIGSLLVGFFRDGELIYAGKVGSGFSRDSLTDLEQRLAPLRRSSSPFADGVPAAQRRDATWVEPALVGEVSFAEWTREGRLRSPVWRGLRADKSPGEVVRE